MAGITVNNGVYHLHNDRISYIFRVVGGTFPMHVYFGARLRQPGDTLRRWVYCGEEGVSRHENIPEALPQEYPTFGSGDLRSPALQITAADGLRSVCLSYRAHEIIEGKPGIAGLPASFDRSGACRTLRLTMADELIGLTCDLYYTIFDDCDIVARHTELRNAGDQPLTIERAMSAAVDFDRDDYTLLTLSGAWLRERYIDARPLVPGEQSVSSARGASSLQSSPFMALLDKGATEDTGAAIGFALVYSGNFYAGVSVDPNRQSRAMIGLNPFDFAWRLEPGEAFATPEAVLSWSGAGLNGMSAQFHALFKRHLTRGRYAEARRPYLLNNWEATYFGFDEDKIVTLAAKAAEIGVELFVLDDGWFGRRDSDNCSLGDWIENRRKLPNGLEGLSQRVHALGLQFGLWFEPEMISPDSDLYRAHPDWCIHIPGREQLEQRHQLVLDLSRADVCEYVYRSVADVLARAGVDYVKWDMNRNFSQIGSALLPPERQKELPHRYILGLYGVMERLVSEFPNVLFESCASGGGRFDLGMFYYMPQAWCSDNTDAISRCFTQYGTSLVFPPCAIGAHVSAVPSHQTGRVTTLKARSDVAMGGTFGYELDVTKLPESELAEMRAQLMRVKSVRDTLMYGDFYRLRSPFTTNFAAWMVVSADRREAVVTCVRLRAEARFHHESLLLRGLDPTLTYRVEETGERMGGDALMAMGLILDFEQGDAASASYILRAE